MTKEQRQQSLVNARRACLMLVEFATGAAPAIILDHGQREEIASLLEEFGRLDKDERRRQKQSRENGSRGGRPREYEPRKPIKPPKQRGKPRKVKKPTGEK